MGKVWWQGKKRADKKWAWATLGIHFLGEAAPAESSAAFLKKKIPPAGGASTKTYEPKGTVHWSENY